MDETRDSPLSIVLIAIAVVIFATSVIFSLFGFFGGLGPETTDFSVQRGVSTLLTVALPALGVALAHARCAALAAGPRAPLDALSRVAVWAVVACDLAVVVGCLGSAAGGASMAVTLPVAAAFSVLGYSTLSLGYPWVLPPWARDGRRGRGRSE